MEHPMLTYLDTTDMPHDLKVYVARCISSRGKRRGRILTSLPKSAPAEARGVWRYLMSCLCCSRAGMWSLVWLPKDAPEYVAYTRMDEWAERHANFNAVVNATLQGPMEFNLWDLHHERDVVIEWISDHAAVRSKCG